MARLLFLSAAALLLAAAVQGDKHDTPEKGTSQVKGKHNLPECAFCSHHSMCASGNCVRAHCIKKTGNKSSRESIVKCLSRLSPVCGACRKHGHCETGKCWNRRCVLVGPLMEISKKRCFRKLCGKCRRNSDCITKKCWSKKCVFKGQKMPHSLIKCFNKRPECAKCRRNKQCSTLKCWRRKCVVRAPRKAMKKSIKKCFPKPMPKPMEPAVAEPSTSSMPSMPVMSTQPKPEKLPECAPCTAATAWKCITHICYKGKCIYGGAGKPDSLHRCGLSSPPPAPTKMPECAPCTPASAWRCITSYCHEGRCIYGGLGKPDSLRRCGPKTSVLPTAVPGTEAEPKKQKLVECDSCKKHMDCASGFCMVKKCIYNDEKRKYRSFYKCFGRSYDL